MKLHRPGQIYRCLVPLRLNYTVTCCFYHLVSISPENDEEPFERRAGT